MSGLKNSPFGKRLRASQKDADESDDHHSSRTTNNNTNSSRSSSRHRSTNPIFSIASSSASSSTTPSLDSRPNTSDSSGPESPIDHPPPPRINRDYYGDRFVPNRDTGDIRASYHLMDNGGPSTPSKKRIIPSESDAKTEQANALFASILHSEVTPPSPPRDTSPTRQPPIASTSSSTAIIPPTTPTRRRLFAYSSPSRSNPSTPSSSRRLDTPTDEAYSMSPVRASSRHILESPRRQLRSVCKTPYRVLDAPELAEDFYLNLVDWSSTNVLGVGLGSCVYLWTAHNAAVSKLCDLQESRDSISSVSWVQRGSVLAVGTLSGKLHVYDANTLQLQRTYHQAHEQRIGALAWNSHVISSGSRDRMVHHRDVREPETRPFRRAQGHKQEVCGLKWSGDGGVESGACLASGGNDNKVCIWDLRGTKRRGMGSGHHSGLGGGVGVGAGAGAGVGPNAGRPIVGSSSGSSREGSVAGGTTGATGGGVGGVGDGDIPLWRFHEHTAAVKALAWDPHVSGVLATGGGTQDKHIRFWNTTSGTLLNQLDTGSQVCNLIWSKTSHELVSTHGFSSSQAQNQICIWKYPSLDMVASLTGHTNRVLYLAMSPDGETIVTGAGDETLRFWNAFPRKEMLGGGGSGGGSGGVGGSGGGAGGSGSGGGGSRGGVGGVGSRLDYGRLIR
ncbi:WD40 repeat-like protein [Dendrothele bispora CBS 962.96]|uniref:WD40 repeat-like protein n=1 Tax=Dendrothele bispora (strain CBS 962.96) TaxID=1314807 RepID=A0A4S8LN27_DENBC|nr:WD40 repeat-like protein [Dendrothele bispora CBS 962.96]